MGQRLKTDWILFIAVLAMLSLGLLILYSASSVMAELRYNSTWHFVGRQFAWAIGAICVMMLLKKTNYRKLQHPGVAFASIGFVILLLILVYFMDSAHHRWLRLGPLSMQPSELAKPALVIFLAFFVSMRAPAINDKHTLLPALIAVAIVVFAVVLADLGTAVVLAVTATVVFLVAGLDWRYFLLAAIGGIVLGAGFIAAKPYRLARVVGYFDPDFKIVDRLDRNGHVKTYLRKSLTSRDTGYQAEQSKIAVGAGGVLGQGLMNGKQKLLYLPEAHTDFIYAVVSEELGLFGAAGLLAGFLVVLWRGLRATVLAHDDFGRYIALGVTTMVVVQAFMNMSVVLGLMPTKGIPLPLISAGGSSLLSTLASLGILMNVSEHAG